MALEDLIRLHTEALIQNTEAVKQLTESLAGRTPPKGNNTTPKVEADPVKQTVEKTEAKPVKEKAGLEYATVRELVLKLAPTHRDAIKAINTKHGLAKLPDLLDDANDFATVNDQAKLEAVHADLQALEEVA